MLGNLICREDRPFIRFFVRLQTPLPSVPPPDTVSWLSGRELSWGGLFFYGCGTRHPGSSRFQDLTASGALISLLSWEIKVQLKVQFKSGFGWVFFLNLAFVHENRGCTGIMQVRSQSVQFMLCFKSSKPVACI